MRLKSFLGLVEIRTKLASVIPFFLGTFYALSHFYAFKFVNFALMLGSLFAFDMVTTALNNYFDYKRATKKHGYNYERHNVIVRDRLNEFTVVTVILLLLITAVFLGVLLVANTNLVVLLVGMLSFLVGVCYSFGPVPISGTPLGELLSGFFMGFVIVFLSIYIHVYDRGMITLAFEKANLLLRMDIVEVLYILLLSVPTICGIANIMLANNICDMEDDLENRRYTLPVYIGKEKALWLFKSLYVLAYIDIAALAILQLLPIVCFISVLTLIPVKRNVERFYALQTKKDTFVLSVRNFMLVSVPLVLFLGISCLFGSFIK